jgi:hypothetical protein
LRAVDAQRTDIVNRRENPVRWNLVFYLMGLIDGLLFMAFSELAFPLPIAGVFKVLLVTLAFPAVAILTADVRVRYLW